MLHTPMKTIDVPLDEEEEIKSASTSSIKTDSLIQGSFESLLPQAG